MLTLDRRVVTFRVNGIPQPKGSARAFVPKSWAEKAVAAGTAPRAVNTSDNPKAKGWEQLIREQAQTIAEGTLFEGPIAVAIVFALQRPKSLPRRVLHHLTKPDVDKLARVVLDGLTGVAYADDRAVIELRVRKRYTVHGTPPGAEITIAEARPPDPSQSAFDLFREEVL